MEISDVLSGIAVIVSIIAIWLSHRKEQTNNTFKLLNIILKYYVSVHNSFERYEKNKLKLKKDELSKKQYLRVLESLESELTQLSNNLYYEKLFFDHPSELILLNVHVLREIAEHRNSKYFGINPGTENYMYQVYNFVKKDISKKKLKKEFKAVEDLVEQYHGIIASNLSTKE